jgi:hypothetical protein
VFENRVLTIIFGDKERGNNRKLERIADSGAT